MVHIAPKKLKDISGPCMESSADKMPIFEGEADIFKHRRWQRHMQAMTLRTAVAAQNASHIEVDQTPKA